jgi:hypothetical protein
VVRPTPRRLPRLSAYPSRGHVLIDGAVSEAIRPGRTTGRTVRIGERLVDALGRRVEDSGDLDVVWMLPDRPLLGLGSPALMPRGYPPARWRHARRTYNSGIGQARRRDVDVVVAENRQELGKRAFPWTSRERFPSGSTVAGDLGERLLAQRFPPFC